MKGHVRGLRRGPRRVEVAWSREEWRVEVAVLFLHCSLNRSGFTLKSYSRSFFINKTVKEFALYGVQSGGTYFYIGP